MAAWPELRARAERLGSRLFDGALYLAALVAGLAEAAAETRYDAWGLLAAALVGTASLRWRRTQPVVPTLVGIGVFLVSDIPFVACFGLATCAARRRDHTLLAYALFVLASFVLRAELGTTTDWFDGLVSGVATAGLCVSMGAYVGVRRDLVESLRERAERAEGERELRAQQAVLEERARIAREMHDVLAHKVSLIALHAGALEVNPSTGRDQVVETANLIRETAHQAVEDLREVLGLLRAAGDDDDAALAPPPRAVDLERIVEASRAAGVPATLDLRIGALPDGLARLVHSVVREALTNVHKHAPGAATTVVVQGDAAQGVAVEVANVPSTAAGPLLPGSGSGLRGLEARVTAIGGRLTTGPDGGGGWQVRAWLPWVEAATAVPT